MGVATQKRRERGGVSTAVPPARREQGGAETCPLMHALPPACHGGEDKEDGGRDECMQRSCVRHTALLGIAAVNGGTGKARTLGGGESGRRGWRRTGMDSAIFLALCLLAHVEASTLIAARHKSDRACSLQTVEGDDIAPMEYCSFLPGLGENKHGRILIQFGESNCKFTLRNCMPVCVFGLCFVPP
jgi:hypothetical protein